MKLAFTLFILYNVVLTLCNAARFRLGNRRPRDRYTPEEQERHRRSPYGSPKPPDYYKSPELQNPQLATAADERQPEENSQSRGYTDRSCSINGRFQFGQHMIRLLKSRWSKSLWYLLPTMDLQSVKAEPLAKKLKYLANEWTVENTNDGRYYISYEKSRRTRYYFTVGRNNDLRLTTDINSAAKIRLICAKANKFLIFIDEYGYLSPDTKFVFGGTPQYFTFETIEDLV